MKKTLIALSMLVSAAASAWAGDYAVSPAIGDIITPETAPVRYRADVVRMGVSRFSFPNANYDIIRPTIAALQKVFGKDRFYAEFISGEVVDPDVFDLILGSAGTYRRFTHRGTRDMASLVSDKFPDPNHAEGSVIAVAARKGAPETLADLKGLRLITTGPKAFTGHQVAMGELLKEGIGRPADYFAEVLDAYHDMRTALTWLREGRGEAAVLRTCFLEELQEAGEDVSDIRVIHQKAVPGFQCRTSTALYPNWTVFLTPHASPDTARKAASALLALSSGARGEHWTIATDFTAVDELFRNLKIGPYEYLQRWSVMDFLKRHWEWFFFAAAAVLGLIFHSVRSERLVDLRTRQLQDAWKRERALQEKAEAAAQHLASIQRASLIGQMSSMIAHELRQPLAAIVNYTQGLMRLLDKSTDKNRAVLETGVATIRSEALKADSIVGKVRAYARRQQANTDRRETDLGDVVEKAAATLAALNRWKTPVHVAPSGRVVIWADPLEIEVAAVNLIKNALEASEGAEGVVNVAVTESETERGAEALIEVSNPAPGLTPQAFERLNGKAQTTKEDGLGLGLSIVRGIADSHAGTLAFVRTTGGGVRAELRLPVKVAE